MIATILKTIIQKKHEEIAAKKRQVSLSDLKNKIPDCPAARPFIQSIQLKLAQKMPAVIAEIKRASPSQGVIREPFNVTEIARSYANAGAACLSVLTDRSFFQGDESYIEMAKSAVDLPVLRKDFIVDEYQIYESRVIGADCILLIVAALSEEQLVAYDACARALGLDVLVEVHNESELTSALKTQATLIGVNHRDLHTFKVDLSISSQLKPLVPDEKIIVAESGIHSAEAVQALQREGIFTYLIGESCMRAPDPGAALAELMGTGRQQ